MENNEVKIPAAQLELFNNSTKSFVFNNVFIRFAFVISNDQKCLFFKQNDLYV